MQSKTEKKYEVSAAILFACITVFLGIVVLSTAYAHWPK